MGNKSLWYTVHSFSISSWFIGGEQRIVSPDQKNEINRKRKEKEKTIQMI